MEFWCDSGCWYEVLNAVGRGWDGKTIKFISIL